MIATAGTLDLATWGEIGSAVAALIAAVTLVFVCVQIYLATEALKLAKKEFDAVREDLEYTKQQTAIINRRAILDLRNKRQRIMTLDSLSTKPRGPEMEIVLSLFNSGRRTARDASIFLWLPVSWEVPGWDTMLDRAQGLRLVDWTRIDGQSYRHFRFDCPSPVYPEIETIVHTFSVVAHHESEEDELLWRVAYDDGITPEQNESYGRLAFAFEPNAPYLDRTGIDDRND